MRDVEIQSSVFDTLQRSIGKMYRYLVSIDLSGDSVGVDGGEEECCGAIARPSGPDWLSRLAGQLLPTRAGSVDSGIRSWSKRGH